MISRLVTWSKRAGIVAAALTAIGSAASGASYATTKWLERNFPSRADEAEALDHLRIQLSNDMIAADQGMAKRLETHEREQDRRFEAADRMAAETRADVKQILQLMLQHRGSTP